MAWDWQKIFTKSQHDHEPHVDHAEVPWSSRESANALHPKKKAARKRQKAARKMTYTVNKKRKGR